MRIHNYSRLRTFWQQFPDAEKSLRAWYRLVECANWKSPADAKAMFGSVDFVGNNRLVFNIGGNKYRLIVAVNYGFHVAYVCFLGTHKRYDQVDAASVWED